MTDDERNHLEATLRTAIEQIDQHIGGGMINWETVEEAFETGTPESFRRQLDVAIQILRSLSSYSGKVASGPV